MQAVYDVYKFLSASIEGKVLDFDKVVLELTTSPGWPWRNRYRTCRDALLDSSVDIWDDYADKEIIFMGFPKYEFLKLEKSTNKTRLVTGVPIDLKVFVARLFQNQDDQLKEMPYPIMVGKTKFYRGWHVMLSRLGGSVDEIDAKQWDGSVRPYEIEYLAWIRFSLLSDEFRTYDNWKRVCWAYTQLCTANVKLSDGSMWSMKGGMKSGWPCTSTDNSIVNLIRLVYAFRMTTDSGCFPFDQVIIYGDDILSSPRNLEYWQHYIDSGSIVPTDRLKLNIPISEAKFLSCSSVRRGNILVPVPDGKKMLFSARWWDVKPTRNLRAEKAKSLWVEAYYSDVVNQLRHFYEETCKSVGMKPVTQSYAEELYLGMEGGWPKMNSNNKNLKCSMCNRYFSTPAARQQHILNVHSRRPTVRRNIRKQNIGQPMQLSGVGQTTVSMKEVLNVKSGLTHYTFCPGSSGLIRLDKYGTLFDDWKINSLKYVFTPTVGTTVGGNYVAAIDVSPSCSLPHRDTIQSLEPRVLEPVWKSSVLVVQPSLVMKSAWHRTESSIDCSGYKASHSLCMLCDASVPIVEVVYSITLKSPSSQRVKEVSYRVLSKWCDDDGKQIVLRPPYLGTRVDFYTTKDSFTKLATAWKMTDVNTTSAVFGHSSGIVPPGIDMNDVPSSVALPDGTVMTYVA